MYRADLSENQQMTSKTPRKSTVSRGNTPECKNFPPAAGKQQYRIYSSSCLDPLTDCVKDWLASNTWVSCFVCKTSDSMLRSTCPTSDQRIHVHALLRRRQALRLPTTLPVLTYYSCEDAIEYFATQICIRWIQIRFTDSLRNSIQSMTYM